MRAGCSASRELARRIEAGRRSACPCCRARMRMIASATAGDVRPPIQHGAVEPVVRGRDRRQVPSWPRCAANISAGLPSSRSRMEPLARRRDPVDAAAPGRARIVDPTAGRYARIRRRRGRDCPTRRAGSSSISAARFFRERGGQIGAADCAPAARGRRARIRPRAECRQCVPAIDQPRSRAAAQHGDDSRARHRQRLRRSARRDAGASEAVAHRRLRN